MSISGQRSGLYDTVNSCATVCAFSSKRATLCSWCTPRSETLSNWEEAQITACLFPDHDASLLKFVECVSVCGCGVSRSRCYKVQALRAPALVSDAKNNIAGVSRQHFYEQVTTLCQDFGSAQCRQ
jgi:hypothetical protein